MNFRKIIAAIGILTALGCSGVTQLVVENRRDSQVAVRVRASFGPDKEVEEWQAIVPVGQKVNALSWASRSEPKSIQVFARSDSKMDSVDVSRANFGSHGYLIVLNPNSISFEAAPFWTNAAWWFLFGSLLLFGLGLWIALRKPHRYNENSNTTVITR